MEVLAIFVGLLFHFLLLPLPELAACFVQNLVESSLFLLLVQFLYVLSSLPLFLLLPDQFGGLVEFLDVLSWALVRQFDEVVQLSLLSLGLVLAIGHHGGEGAREFRQIWVDVIVFLLLGVVVVDDVVGGFDVGLLFVYLIGVVSFFKIGLRLVVLLSLIDHFFVDLLFLFAAGFPGRDSLAFESPPHIFLHLQLGDLDGLLPGQVAQRICVDHIVVEEPDVDFNARHCPC